MTTEQGSLFPSEEQPIDLGAISRHIAKHAKLVEYPDRFSEAAIDQGRGSVPPPLTPQAKATPEASMLPTAPPKKLTRAERNAREDQRIAAHLERIGRSPSSVRDPNYR